MTERIGVLGGGSWGTALAVLLANKGLEVEMWVRNKSQVDEMNETRVNNKYLPNAKLPVNLIINDDLEKTIHKKDVILLSVPTHGVRETLLNAKSIIDKKQIIVNVAKGIENDTLMRISEIVKEILPNNKYAMLSGPSHAEEVALDIPTTIVSASLDKEVAEYIQELFITPSFRVYTNPDIIGVELGGALKNIIALGAGISDGLNYGDNTKAALMTRGIIEIARLGTALGANANTFTGLSGIGDLIVTCTSMHSRNRRCGILLGQGLTLDESVKEIGMVVEGVKTTKSAFKISEKLGVEMPITDEIYNVLYNNANVKDSVNKLMGRDKKHEMEDVARNFNYNW
ncbi:NAD(P)H-dependent glycerol-3-phosphate dehydrogenase [Tissierella sp. Yu-01]|uniref:NAD(P)H-dependent glycerol-3-phosphate dehydrogenase n=1 Tax=Tissierella sp. Yu-01 TaxID=3035694 RepID=UPI00240E6BB1|nr:NAD(P)H-dependent glycerol-3-phosphate dehydrogenase [Tissierella sp. Yu-01]WFA09835.1 NAD(P)H-dependent glycerol-3-phosphate dehydrogenase [Tissierella sp. Yu-01]